MLDVQIIINCTLNIDFLSDHMESVDLILRGPQIINRELSRCQMARPNNKRKKFVLGEQ